MIIEKAREVVHRITGKRVALLPEEEAAYQRLVLRGFRPGGIVDVGAYEGNWTRTARNVFPDVPVVMVEPQPGKVSYLEKVCADLPGVTFRCNVLSSSSGETLTLQGMETGTSIFPENSNVPRVAFDITSKTLDEVARPLSGPLFVKTDVQGAELLVLAGGRETLTRAEIVELEVAVLP
jgi:FkbM family methyltransferase